MSKYHVVIKIRDNVRALKGADLQTAWNDACFSAKIALGEPGDHNDRRVTSSILKAVEGHILRSSHK